MNRLHDFKKHSSWNQEEITSEMFKQFSAYLLHLKRENENHYSLGTVWQYLSGVYNALKRDHPNLSLWTEDLVSSGSRGDMIPRCIERYVIMPKEPYVIELLKMEKNFKVNLNQLVVIFFMT